MRVTASIGERGHGFGFFERAEVLPLEVLDERDLDNLGVVNLADNDGQIAQADPNGSLIAPFARHNLKTGSPLSDHERLDDALLADRGHQLRKIAHDLARLIGIGLDLIDWHETANRRACGIGQRVDVVLVVAHFQ
ncbi:MAG TPA: hypothetical protein VHD57_16325 [Vicinamibacterales bacterium]|nr:hypothetical protein [Vicinamibacterales bacterium]